MLDGSIIYVVMQSYVGFIPRYQDCFTMTFLRKASYDRQRLIHLRNVSAWFDIPVVQNSNSES